MPKVMAVTFEQYGRLHYLDPGEVDYRVGDWVLYPLEDGTEVARVVWAPEDTAVAAPLPRCADGPPGRTWNGTKPTGSGAARSVRLPLSGSRPTGFR